MFLFVLANVDASVMYRRWKESVGKDDEYKTIIIRQVKKSQEEAIKDGVTSEFVLNMHNFWSIWIIMEHLRVPTDYR